MPRTRPAPIFIAGPTGCGKSEIATALALSCGGEVVNADAYQLYAGMPVLTAAPSPTEQATVPHHLFGVISPRESCNAATFAEMAVATIGSIAARGRVPVVVGGSGLYLKALTHGLSPLPAGAPALREAFEHLPLELRHRWLCLLDPKGSQTIDPRNPRYVDRALEICLLTGEPASRLKRDGAGSAAGEPAMFPGAVGHALIPDDREAHYARINDRTRSMLEAGVVDEIAALPSDLSATASRAIGLQEFRQHLAGEISLEEAVAAVQQATRRYAKRQLTWFRREPFFQTVCLDLGAGAVSTARQILAGPTAL